MLKLELKKYLKNKQQTVLDLDQDKLLDLVVQESRKYTKKRPRVTRDQLEEILRKSFEDASNTLKAYSVRL